MILIMIASGLLTSMYIWSAKVSDIRISINDIYMISLMIGWMVFFMSMMDKKWNYAIVSLICTLVVYILIRRQTFVTMSQYYRGMIPHHSMAILMSKRVLEKYPNLSAEDKAFVEGIIQAQEREIDWMKARVE